MTSSNHNIDRIDVKFDHDNAVANAGLLLTSTLTEKLGLEAATDAMVTVGYRPGRKLSTLVSSLLAGGDCIDDIAVLHAGASGRVLGHGLVAASTTGTWLRQFTFGHVRQLDRVSEAMLTRAWQAGAGPGGRPVTIDVDSTIVEVHGKAKQGAAYGYTRQLGLHPLLATRADTGEVLHTRMRKGSANTARGAQRFVRETVGRVRRAGATGRLHLRGDAGFWSKAVMGACTDHGMTFSLTVRRTQPIKTAIAAIPDTAWRPIAYTRGGTAQVAETVYKGRRLIVRRTRIDDDPDVLALFDQWRHHAFVTNRTGNAVMLDRDHRAHAVVELAIRDLKDGAGLAHCPSGVFTANAAWLVATALAHNIVRWTQLLDTVRPTSLMNTATLRRRLLALPGRLTTTSRTTSLRLPTRWPWAEQFDRLLLRLRALPAIA